MTTRFGNADLDRRKPDTGRGIHRFEHVLDQRAQRLVDGLDRLGFQPQPLIGNDQDVANSHGGDLRGWDTGVNAAFPLETTTLSPYRSPFVRARRESR